MSLVWAIPLVKLFFFPLSLIGPVKKKENTTTEKKQKWSKFPLHTNCNKWTWFLKIQSIYYQLTITEKLSTKGKQKVQNIH